MSEGPATFREAGTLRVRAESLVRLQPGGISSRQAKVGAPRIIQELQIHQIELELQNEELRQAKAVADAKVVGARSVS